ncbi:unnamed protein product [Mytilus edulis]|uniref:Uncharacterized protein n=1 Tax=Mytilus edulis TaxID=6550 RepID=A0A8S3SXZ4_MYTED|nr:unnamed protein product [Mytilus edulis]
MKKSIVDYLNKLEQQIIDELGSKHEKLVSNMDTIVKQMEQRASQIGQMQNDFIQMTQYATELQMYVGLNEIETFTSESAKYIETLESGNLFDDKNIEVNISSHLQSILRDVESFGDINISSTFSTFRVKTGRKDQAQHLVSNTHGVEQIRPSMLRQLTIPEDMKYLNILACLVLFDGQIIILEKNKKQLLLFRNDGILIGEVVTFSQYPCDVCLVRNNTVAVTLEIGNETALVDVEKDEILKLIRISHSCKEVASDGQIMVVCNEKTSTVVNLNDMSQTILGVVVGRHISLLKGNIYGIIYNENRVSCYTKTGEPLWTFQHPDIDFPHGLTLDKNGFVYIVSYGNNSIVVVSPDGKTCKTILSRDDGIKYPWAIDINRETGMMIVSTRTGMQTIIQLLFIKSK